MPGFGELAFSMAMRDTIARMVREEIDRSRPRYRYATVVDIDRVARKCDVIFNGENAEVRVNMGSIQPWKAGQIVRVEGIGTDKFITDVIGEPWAGGRRWGVVAPYYTAGNAYVIWEGDVNPSGPYPPAGGYQPRSGDTVFGTELLGHGTVILKAGFQTEEEGFPRWHRPAFVNGWFDYTSPWNAQFGPLASYAHAGFTRTSTGIVKLKGLIARGGTAVAGETIFTLPVGFRPSKDCMFSSEGAAPRGAVDVYADGRVAFRSGTGGFFSLEGVTFPSAEVAPEAAWTNFSLVNGFTNFVDTNGGGWAKASWWTDAEGIVWRRGLVSRATAPGIGMDITGPVPALTVPLTQHMRTTGGNGFGFILNLANGRTHFGNPTPSNYFSLDGMPIVPTASPMTSRWQQILGVNSWVNYDPVNFSTAEVLRTPSGLVILKGLLKGGTVGTIGTLRPGYRPGKMSLQGAVSNSVGYRLDIQDGGTILASTGYSNAWLALDGVHYVAEQ